VLHQKMARLEANCKSHNANKQLARMNGKADLFLQQSVQIRA
jgi:hypothetical protein